MAGMRYIIQKFGGTSVSTAELREQVAQKILAAQKLGYHPVVVVSAMGRNGDPYATDTLINLTNDNPPNSRELDLLMACGEIISGVILTTTLQEKGCKAIFLTGGQAGIITDDNFGNARIIRVDPTDLNKYAQSENIVVVAGFQGVSESGEVTTLGRGGSDTTAAALGIALNAEVIDIYTDVEGIMTADPRIVHNARLLDKVTYNEICQLAHEGAKVIHPRAVELAMQKNIPLRVRSTFSEGLGTLVTAQGKLLESTSINSYDLITGITQIPSMTQLKVRNVAEAEPTDMQLNIFKAMAAAGISVDFINVSPKTVIYTVRDEIAEKAVQILHQMDYQVKVTSGCAKIAVVGAGMTGIPGVMASIVEALAKVRIRILQSADSYTTIWVLVQKEDMVQAVRSLHEQFMLHCK